MTATKKPMKARKMAREGATVVMFRLSSNRDSPMAILITGVGGGVRIGRAGRGRGRNRCIIAS